MKKYALAAAAEEDVLGIADYLAQANTTAARSFIVDFAKECERIAAFPKMGRNRTEMGSEIMSLPFHRYLI